jgi:hypothetical protein
MKTIRQFITLAITLLLASACATTSSTIPKKYNLDDQLENVADIPRSNLMSWDTVDNQCFTLQTSSSDYYLIVLEDRANTLFFTGSIQISNMDASFRGNYGDVILNDDGWEDRYSISKIYKFRDHEQVREIKAQLSNETD